MSVVGTGVGESKLSPSEVIYDVITRVGPEPGNLTLALVASIRDTREECCRAVCVGCALQIGYDEELYKLGVWQHQRVDKQSGESWMIPCAATAIRTLP